MKLVIKQKVNKCSKVECPWCQSCYCCVVLARHIIWRESKTLPLTMSTLITW